MDEEKRYDTEVVFLLTNLIFCFVLTCDRLAAAQAADSLPSWNDGKAKQSIIEFVTHLTKEGSSDVVPTEERIATFDNDGTLWAEKPVYFQLLFALDRVKTLASNHPEWSNKEPFASLLKGDSKAALAGGEHAMLDIVMATHAGMTTVQFERIVKDWTCRGLGTMEPHSPDGEGVSAVEHQQMQVDVQVQRRAEALDERHNASLCASADAKTGTTLHRRGQGARHNREHVGEQVGTRREEQAQRPRKGQHPLAYGHAGEHRAPSSRPSSTAAPTSARTPSRLAKISPGRSSSSLAQWRRNRSRLPLGHGVGVYDDETTHPARPGGSQSDPEGSVDIVEHWTRALALECQDLLSQGQVLDQELRPSEEQRPDDAGNEPGEKCERAEHGHGVCRHARASSSLRSRGRQGLTALA